MTEAESDVRFLMRQVEFCERAAKFNRTRTSGDILRSAMARLNEAIDRRNREAKEYGR